jgi:hypothetical protein
VRNWPPSARNGAWQADHSLARRQRRRRRRPPTRSLSIPLATLAMPPVLPLCRREASSFACAIMGDLHLEPGHQMALFEEARSQLVAAVTEPGVAAPRVVQLGEGGAAAVAAAATLQCTHSVQPPLRWASWATAA